MQERPISRPDQCTPNRVVQANRRGGEAAKGQRKPDGEERHETQAEHCEVGADHVGGVLGPTEPGFHHGEPGLHEDHHRGPDDHPEEVDLGAQNLHRVGDALSAGHLREQRHNGAANRGGCAKAKE